MNIFAGGDVIGCEVGSQMATPVGSQDGGIAAHNAFTSEPRPPRWCEALRPRVAFRKLDDESMLAFENLQWFRRKILATVLVRMSTVAR
jgi:hypothetical protein